MRRTCLVLPLGFLATVFMATTVLAQPKDADRALATELFQQARDLMAKKNFAQACPRFEESQRLDPGGGTLLNLALCNEGLGKTATAWSQFNEAIAIAQRDGRRDREDLAQEHASSLESKLSRIVIEVPAEADIPDLVIMRDGSAVAKLAWGTAMPVDPGEHLVEVSAPGRVSWSTTANVGGDAARERVVVPVLGLAPAPRPLEPPAEPPPPVVVSAPAPHQGTVDRSPALSTQTVAGIAVLGVGGAALTVGTVLGFVALGEYNALDCQDDVCSEDKGDDADAVNRLRYPSTAMLIVGGAAVATGLVVVLTAPKKPAKAALELTPGALFLRGRF